MTITKLYEGENLTLTILNLKTKTNRPLEKVVMKIITCTPENKTQEISFVITKNTL